jgi:hypothetical protein
MAIFTTQVTVGTTAALIGPTHYPDEDGWPGCSIMIYNPGPTAVLLGNASVTAATGFTLISGATFQADLHIGELVYGIVATGTQVVQSMETGV